MRDAAHRARTDALHLVPDAGLEPPPPRPNLRVTEVALFEREVRERLSQAALEVLMGRAEVAVEGAREAGPQGVELFVGTVLVTVELAEIHGLVRGPLDAVTSGRVAATLADDPRARERLLELARRALEEHTGARLRKLAAEVLARAEGTRLRIDCDVEAALRPSAGAARAR